MQILYSLPIILASVLLALFSVGLLGYTSVLSSLFGTAYLDFVVDMIFFLLTAFYAFILLVLQRHLRFSLFTAFLWGLIIILTLIVIVPFLL